MSFRRLTGAGILLAFLVVTGTAPADMGKPSPAPKETEQKEKKPEASSPAPADQGKAAPAPKETKETKETEQKEKKPEASPPAPADQGKAAPAPKETKETKETEQKEKKPEASPPTLTVPGPPPVTQPPLPSNPLPLQMPPVPKVEAKPEKPCPPASGDQKSTEKSAQGDSQIAPCRPAAPPPPQSK